MSIVIFMTLYHYAQIQPGLFYKIIYAPISVIAVLLLCFFLVFLHAWRWYRLNCALNIPLTFKQTVIPTYIGNAFNALLPGSVGGDIFRLYIVAKGFPNLKTEASLSVVVDRICGFVGLLIITALTAVYYLAFSNYSGPLWELIVACLSISLFIGLCSLFLGVLPVGKVAFLHQVLKFARSTRFCKNVDSIISSIILYKNSKMILFESLMVSILCQLTLLSAIILVNHMMVLPSVSAFDFMLAIVLSQVASLLPIAPGGLGVGEACFANTLILLHPHSTAAFATVYLTVRIISGVAYLPGVIFGLCWTEFNTKATPVCQN
jgi:uncharacterized protein (TIRG00374 family)